jgi:hypothetical protein
MDDSCQQAQDRKHDFLLHYRESESIFYGDDNHERIQKYQPTPNAGMDCSTV